MRLRKGLPRVTFGDTHIADLHSWNLAADQSLASIRRHL
jgi:hypothetical protein